VDDVLEAVLAAAGQSILEDGPRRLKSKAPAGRHHTGEEALTQPECEIGRRSHFPDPVLSMSCGRFLRRSPVGRHARAANGTRSAAPRKPAGRRTPRILGLERQAGRRLRFLARGLHE
jgi:hypothetical protein